MGIALNGGVAHVKRPESFLATAQRSEVPFTVGDPSPGLCFACWAHCSLVGACGCEGSHTWHAAIAVPSVRVQSDWKADCRLRLSVSSVITLCQRCRHLLQLSVKERTETKMLLPSCRHISTPQPRRTAERQAGPQRLLLQRQHYTQRSRRCLAASAQSGNSIRARWCIDIRCVSEHADTTRLELHTQNEQIQLCVDMA